MKATKMKENNIKKVLVAGGAGYLGSVLVRELLEHGYSVKVLDRLYFTDSGLRAVRDQIELVVGDIRSMDPAALDGVDAVINAAGLYNELTELYDSGANYQMNTHATASLAFLCKGKGVKRFVFASSCAVYHKSGALENPDILFDEKAVVSPETGYGRSKLEAEELLLGMADKNFCPVVLRKGTLFGFSPRMRYDLMVNTFLRDSLACGRMTLRSGGEMWRPMLEVRDAARAYITCLEAPEKSVRGQIFNVAQRNYRVSELALNVRQAMRGSGESAEVGMASGRREECSYRVSSDKIKRVLGFSASTTVEESVAHMLREIKAAHFTDFDNARYCNIKWIQQLLEAEKIIRMTGAVFSADRNAPPSVNSQETVPRPFAARVSPRKVCASAFNK
jgi:nucleoside-diphosphate-sugar epimerase